MHALRVIVDAAREDDASAALWDGGTIGVEVKAAREGRVELVAYFGGDPDRAGLERALPGAEIAPRPRAGGRLGGELPAGLPAVRRGAVSGRAGLGDRRTQRPTG